MKTAVLILVTFALMDLNVHSQNSTNTWKGSSSKGATNWHDGHNWSLGHEPTEEEQVYIPNLSHENDVHYPVIKYQAHVHSILMEKGAKLILAQHAQLRILDPKSESYLRRGKCLNWGVIYLGKTDNKRLQETIDSQLGRLVRLSK
ncbi:MAG: hypothetical protein AAFY71_09545 [Bacteroidota bacterium]